MSKKLKKVNKFSSSESLGERLEIKLSKTKSVGKMKKVDDEVKKEITSIKKKPMKKKSKENASGENVKVLRKKPEAPPAKTKLKNVKSNPEMKIRKTRKRKEIKGPKEVKSCPDHSIHFDRLATSFSYESFKNFEIEHDFDFDPFEDEEFRRNLFRTDLVWKGSKYKKRVSRSPILSEIDEEPDELEYLNEKNDKRVFKRWQHNIVPMSKKMSRKIKK